MHSETLQRLIRPQVAGLPVYDPGADPAAVMRQYGVSRVIKLSNNENPLGMSPKAARAIEQCLAHGLGRYPDPAGKALCLALAERHDLPPENIILGNGSENILELLCQAYLNPGDRVVTQTPCFGLHEIFPAMMGARLTKVAPAPAFGCDLDGWRTALQEPLKLLLISQPSNPVGTALNRDELHAIVQACPADCLLVIDEAYYEYAVSDPDYPDALQVLRQQQRPWIVLRTFSKAHGLASLRVGYGLASHASLVEALHRVRTPYNVNQLAQAAALAALDDSEHLQRSVTLVTGERDRVSSALRTAGYQVASSLANFLFIETDTAASVTVQRLLRSGVIVKAWREPQFLRFIRMSLALPADNDQFLHALTAAD
ncbi:histidinol-phosphate transaminase [Pseudomonas sp. 21LCFQ02]|uniref:histidinol-phosphate transaminase n=1 Tax=Pseudomonas sp. 21LCFQ02 TaxID=2957505 RepID=UPI00209AE4C9|nr:histidinol-phosphate transaminase [Pseudomonas sp. 21LCFQ02]MCO8169447.1 histidinol-phosphate transaminase [Pseudomonas sp. 21LCFQ02]